MEADLVLRAVMLPAIIAALVVAAALASSPSGRRATAIAVALVPVAAVLPTFRALAVQQGGFLSSGLPSTVSYGWLPAAFAVAACCAAVVSAGGSRLALDAAAIVAPAAAMSLLSPPGFRGGEAQLAWAAVGAVAALSACRARREPTREAFAGWWALLSVASAFAIVAGFAKLAFVVASIAATAAALGVASIAVARLRGSPALDVALSAALAAFAFVGMAYDEAPLPRASWVALALAPGSALVASLPVFRPRPRLRSAVRAAAPAAVAALALAGALLWSHRTHRDGDGADAYSSIIPP